MNQAMIERILEFEALYAATLPPPAPRLVRQNAERHGDQPSEPVYMTDSDEEMNMEN